MNNPFQLMMQMARSGQNPQQLVMNFLEQQAKTSPMGQNLLQLAQAGKTQDIEQIARNICKTRGLDYDTEFAAFKQSLGL